MKKFKFKIRGNTFDTTVKKVENNTIEMEVNGTAYTVEIETLQAVSKTPKLVRTRVKNKPGEGVIEKKSAIGSIVIAPLPGTIFKINVKVGDEIKAGDVLLIMEAMKMENNIMAEKSGTVKSINIKEGDAVLQDAKLIELQ